MVRSNGCTSLLSLGKPKGISVVLATAQKPSRYRHGFTLNTFWMEAVHFLQSFWQWPGLSTHLAVENLPFFPRPSGRKLRLPVFIYSPVVFASDLSTRSEYHLPSLRPFARNLAKKKTSSSGPCLPLAWLHHGVLLRGSLNSHLSGPLSSQIQHAES